MVRLVRASDRFEALVRALSVLTFILMAWVGHRVLSDRPSCVHSSGIRSVTIEGRKVFNCQLESRLDLEPLLNPLRPHIQKKLRAIEALEPLSPFSGRWSQLNIEIVDNDPRAFSQEYNQLKIGSDWLNQPDVLLRAFNQVYLTLHTHNSNLIQTQVLADFLRFWLQPKETDVMRMASTPLALNDACLGDYRSVQLEQLCGSRILASLQPRSPKLYGSIGVWPLLSYALAQVVRTLPLSQREQVLQNVWASNEWPVLKPPQSAKAQDVAEWLESSVDLYLTSLGVKETPQRLAAFKSTMKNIGVEAPLRWELTVDLRHTPKWTEILDQLKKWSQFRLSQRTLVFTPNGEVALPSGTRVAWAATDIRSQKHVMVACHWPAAQEAIPIEARQFFAHQSCDRLNQPFWEN